MRGAARIRQPCSLFRAAPLLFLTVPGRPRTDPAFSPGSFSGLESSRDHRLARTPRRRRRRGRTRLRSLLRAAGRRGRPGHVRAGRVRLQRGERLVRPDPVRRMRPGVRPARGRRRGPGGRRGGRGRRRAAAALRPLPSAAARGRRRSAAGRHRGRPGGAQRAAPGRLQRDRPGRPARGDAVTDAVSLIRAKRDGQRLADDDIRWLFEAYARHEVADEQMSALLMAIFFRGLNPAELRAWTAAMIASGDRLDLSAVGRPTVDKHSTGGVGDKVSLILAPLVACFGAAVPQLSGRGLGHTGGTLDKLEAIPGWRALLPPAEMISVLRREGCVICAAGPGLAPADRRLYALRDVTGTVESIPLIASSIMSKKIAEGTAALVLDVKVGSGAFMREAAAARELARTMVELGTES